MTKKLSRIVALMLAVIMSFSMLLVPVEAASFKDVSNKAWYKAAVDYVAERGLMSGVSSTTFAPNMKVTRGMAVTVLAKVAEADLSAYEPAFADTEAGKWYTKAAAWAADKGIVAGVGDGMFAPNRVITRQDLAVMLKRYMEFKSFELPAVEPKIFNDISEIAGYAKNAAFVLSNGGLISGFDDGGFHPADSATRAQFAQMVMRMDMIMNGEEGVIADAKPAQSFMKNAGEDMQISVEAPAGALPENTDMTVSRVTDEVELAALQAKVSGDLVAAADITFTKNGEELEPGGAVEVMLKLEGLEDLQNPTVYHINKDGVAEPVFDQQTISLNRSGSSKALRFYAKDFSVYIVVNDPVEDNARLTIKFVNPFIIDETEGEDDPAEPTESEDPDAPLPGEIARMYVKNSDDAMVYENGQPIIDEETGKQKHHVDLIVYDPGLGDDYNAEAGDVFLGWTTNPDYTVTDEGKSVDQIRTEIKARTTANNIIDGETITYYAMIMKVYTVTYVDENEIALSSINVKRLKEAGANPNNHPPVTFRAYQEYTPNDPNKHFEGWFLGDDKSKANVTSIPAADKDKPIENGTNLTIVGDIYLKANAPKGNWLVYYEVLKGATFTPAVFLTELVEDSVRPTNPTCNGYEFIDWYEAETDENGKVVYDENGDPVLSDTAYTFGSPIDHRTHLFAKWRTADSAPYTVVIWQQKETGSGYNYVTSVPLSGTPNSNITTVTSTGSGDSSVAVINGSSYSYTGFHLNSYDTGKKIDPAGGTVINVYYDRNNYTLTFKAPVTVNNPSNNDTELYGYVDGIGYVKLTRRSGSWQFQYNGGWYSYSRYGNGYYYHFTEIKTISGLFGANIANQFPIVGTNNVSYSGYVWEPQSSTVFTTGDVPKLETIPAENTVFHAKRYGTEATAHLDYYIQCLPNEEADVVIDGINFKLHVPVSVDIDSDGVNSTRSEDFTDIIGFVQYKTDPEYGSNGTVALNSANNYTIKFYYKRAVCSFVYNDGRYVDGDGKLITTETIRQSIHVDSGIMYGSDVSSYAKGGANAYTPVFMGYVFGGWYANEECSVPYSFDTMPLGSVNLYALWRKVQYRVYLDPNNENALEWGTEKPTLCFRGNYGETIGVTRPEQENKKKKLVAWYLDEACTQPYEDSMRFTGNESYFSDYKMFGENGADPDWTDTFDKNGHLIDPKKNSDQTGDRFNITDENAPGTPRYWITKKMTLYGKWRTVLEGSSGIQVEYVFNTSEGHEEQYSSDPDQNAAWPADNAYYYDTAKALARSALEPTYSKTVDGETVQMRFMHWKIMKWENNAWVESGKIVYPGGEYDITEEYCKVTPITVIDPETQQETDGNSYVMRLMAVYDRNDQENPTHITWFGNGGLENQEVLKEDAEGSELQDGVYESEAEKINKPVLIPAGNSFEREGYTFLGWSREKEDTCLAIGEDGKPVLDEYGNKVYIEKELSYGDLWLTYHPAETTTTSSVDPVTGKVTVLTHTKSAYYTADVNGNPLTVVEKVAADEHLPYHTLYAVWSNEYFVYHSSDGTIQALTPNKASGEGATGYAAIDLTAFVRSGYLYGGYFLDDVKVTEETVEIEGEETTKQIKTITPGYGGVTAANVDAGKYEALGKKGENVQKIANVPEALLYDGSKLYDDGSDHAIFDDDHVQQNHVLWNYNQAQTASGRTLVPVGGKVYYLKEVPNDYLPNKLMYTYHANNTNEITDIYLLSCIDDACYTNCGFLIDDVASQYGTLASQFTLDVKDWGKLIFTPKNLNGNLKRGYMAVRELGASFVVANKSFTVQPVWTTRDNISIAMEKIKYTISSNKKEITWETISEEADPYFYAGYSAQNNGNWLFSNDAVIRGCFVGQNGTANAWVEFEKVPNINSNLAIMRTEKPSGDFKSLVIVRDLNNVGIDKWSQYDERTYDIWLEGYNYLLSFDMHSVSSHSDGYVNGSWGTYKPLLEIDSYSK